MAWNDRDRARRYVKELKREIAKLKRVHSSINPTEIRSPSSSQRLQNDGGTDGSTDSTDREGSNSVLAFRGRSASDDDDSDPSEEGYDPDGTSSIAARVAARSPRKSIDKLGVHDDDLYDATGRRRFTRSRLRSTVQPDPNVAPDFNIENIETHAEESDRFKYIHSIVH